LESGLHLVCVSGVEDKLQDGVPDTIRTLLAAGVRVWVITGDKQQTAITIGAACGLLHTSDSVLLLNADSHLGASRRLEELQALAASHAADSTDGTRGPELVIDGATLTCVVLRPAAAEGRRLTRACLAGTFCQILHLRTRLLRWAPALVL